MFSAISVIRCGTHHREDVHLETRPPVLRLNRTERPELDVATRVVNEDAESAEAQGGRRRSAAPQPVQRKPAQRDSLGGIRGLRPEEPRRLRCHLPLRRRHLRVAAGAGRVQGRPPGHWAILADGGKALIHLSLGNKESYEDWGYPSRSRPTAPPDSSRPSRPSGRKPSASAAGPTGPYGAAPCPMGPGRVRRQLSLGHEELGRRSSGQPGSPQAPSRSSKACPDHQPHRACFRGRTPPGRGHPPFPRREGVPEAGLRHPLAGE